MLSSLRLEECSTGRVFIDGGSNTGDSVRSFLSGGFYSCALHGPHRLYNSEWPKLAGRARRAAMAPLREPQSFCIRSFEANPRLVPLLRAGAPAPGAAAASAVPSNVRYIDAALSNRTGRQLPRTVVRARPSQPPRPTARTPSRQLPHSERSHTQVTYARNLWGSSASTLAFGDIHPSKPPVLSTEQVRGDSYDLSAVLRETLRQNASAVIAVKLDVEGAPPRKPARAACP